MKILYLRNKGLTCYVDDEDYDKVKYYTWRALKGHNTYYAVADIRKNGKYVKTICMHRFLMGAERGEQIDHANGNGLDNVKSNLRRCNDSQNQANRGKSRNKSIKYKGVKKNTGGWSARITYYQREYQIGNFNNIKYAAIAYDGVASVLHKSFAVTNESLYPDDFDDITLPLRYVIYKQAFDAMWKRLTKHNDPMAAEFGGQEKGSEKGTKISGGSQDGSKEK